MSKRFEGAITTPDEGVIPDQSIPPPPERPPRPVLIELSAAILIVGGVTSILGTIGYQLNGGSTGIIGLLIVGLNLATIVVGFLIRGGRAWILAINVVAISLFLELTGLPSAYAGFFAVVDLIVLFTLFRYRAWFEWRPPDPAGPAA